MASPVRFRGGFFLRLCRFQLAANPIHQSLAQDGDGLHVDLAGGESQGQRVAVLLYSPDVCKGIETRFRPRKVVYWKVSGVRITMVWFRQHKMAAMPRGMKQIHSTSPTRVYRNTVSTPKRRRR